MLRDSQPISYGGTDLIRVSFAFGDVDGDGNEDMFIAGQSQEEQEDNISGTLGRYVYDNGSGEMTLESMQNLKVINGTWSEEEGSEDTFYSSNGWDGYYHSVPLMKTNLAVGKIMGESSDTKIYLDSVLYSYDEGSYEIVDELEDDSKDKEDNYKGSCVFGGDKAMMGRLGDSSVPSNYFEFGADCGNFSGAASDYVLVNRVSTSKRAMGAAIFYPVQEQLEATASILLTDKKGRLIRKDPVPGSSEYKGQETRSQASGIPIFGVAADTDVDGMVVEYTGEHEIQYQDPNVLAVLASPPYFKDVAAYDNSPYSIRAMK